MKKFCLIFPLVVLLIYCGNSTTEITVDKPSSKTFQNISFKKVFTLKQIGGGVCMPFSQGFLVYEVLGGTSVLKRYDRSGKFKNKTPIRFGQGPGDIFSMTELFYQGENIMFIDNNTYLKSINPHDSRIQTISKLSNKIEDYHTKFIFCRRGSTSVEYYNGSTVAAFATNTSRNDDFYIVSYKGNFDNFKVLRKIKRVPKNRSGIIDRNKRNESVHDYFGLTAGSTNLTVDWKNRFIYFIRYYDNSEIFRIDMNGDGLTRIKLNIDSSDFIVDKNKVELWYKWAVDDTPRRFKVNKKHIYKYPKTAPALRDVDIIGNWLLVTSGKRNWETYENEVFVYRLPELQFVGSFFIPTGDWPSKIFGNTLVTKRIVKIEDEYFFQFDCYEILIQ